MSAVADRCGTYAEYQQHRKRAEEPCADCRRAAADYMRSLRKRSPNLLIRESRESAARSRAFTRLRALHPAQFDILYAEELAR